MLSVTRFKTGSPAYFRTWFGDLVVESSQKVADADEGIGVLAENFSPCLLVSVRGLRRRQCGGSGYEPRTSVTN